MKTVISESTAQTEQVGYELGTILQPGDVVAMFGDLGAGKTAFTRGVAKGMGINCDVFSPTFAIVNEYRDNGRVLYHFDMYRIESWNDLYSTGYFDYLETDAVLIIEWSENIEAVLPELYTRVEIEKLSDENKRQITIGGNNEFENSCN